MIESLYFSCYYAYLLGDLEKALMYYDFLREEFSGGGFKDSLSSYQLMELSRIRSAIRTGNIIKCRWLESCELGEVGFGGQDLKQCELVEMIHRSSGQMAGILSDDIRLYNIEHPCPPYGKVDMVYKGRRTIYPVEVKRDQGQHDLIGQIMKYDLFHRLRLHYKHYEFVRSITICRSYQDYVLEQLKMNGIVTLVYSVHKGMVNLKPV